MDLASSERFDRWCILINVWILVGKAQFDLERTNVLMGFEPIMYQISNGENYMAACGRVKFQGCVECVGARRSHMF